MGQEKSTTLEGMGSVSATDLHFKFIREGVEGPTDRSVPRGVTPRIKKWFAWGASKIKKFKREKIQRKEFRM